MSTCCSWLHHPSSVCRPAINNSLVISVWGCSLSCISFTALKQPLCSAYRVSSLFPIGPLKTMKQLSFESFMTLALLVTRITCLPFPFSMTSEAEILHLLLSHISVWKFSGSRWRSRSPQKSSGWIAPNSTTPNTQTSLNAWFLLVLIILFKVREALCGLC